MCDGVKRENGLLVKEEDAGLERDKTSFCKWLACFDEALFRSAVSHSVATPPEGDEWLHEIKFDGYRLLAYVFGGASRLLTRNGKDWTNSFRHCRGSREAAGENAVLDMEAVMLDEDGKSSFQALQAALGEGGNRASIVAYVFDLLYIDEADITKKPLLDRKERLADSAEKQQIAASL